MREVSPFPEEIRRGRRTLRFSNLDKLFWPEEGITKGDLLAYYRAVAAVVVPHLRARPFTMKRYPDGWQGKSFFQKDTPKHAPDWLRTAPFPATSREGDTRVIDYAVVDDELALLWVVSMGCLDLHTWTSRVDRPDRPDWVIFDLDPSEGCGFPEVVEAARLTEGAARPPRAEELPEDERVARAPRARADRAAPYARRRPRICGDDRRRSRAGPSGARDDAVVEGKACRRPRRREPERAWQDDGDGLLGAAAGRRARLDPSRWDEVVPALDPTGFTMGVVIERIARHGDLFAPVSTAGSRSRPRSGRSSDPRRSPRHRRALPAAKERQPTPARGVRPPARGHAGPFRNHRGESVTGVSRLRVAFVSTRQTLAEGGCEGAGRLGPVAAQAAARQSPGARWFRAESSTMSRRKQSAIVQSVTTRAFRRSVGSA